MQETIIEAIRAIEKLMQSNNSELSVTIETGSDEAGLVGSRDAYLRLAKVTLEFILASERGELQEWGTGELRAFGSTMINQVFDSSCEIVIDTTSLAKSDQQAQDISKYYKETSPRQAES